MTDLQIEPISEEIGARITVAPEHILDEGVPEQILEALNKYGVLLFPKIFLDDESMAALSNRLGEMEANPDHGFLMHVFSPAPRTSATDLFVSNNSQRMGEFALEMEPHSVPKQIARKALPKY